MNVMIEQNLARQRLPVLTPIEPNLWCASFFVMKQVVAHHAIVEAEKNGELRPGMHIIESSSGSVALGVAIEGTARGYNATLVGDPAIDSGLASLLDTLGVQVEIVTATAPGGGHQLPRLRRLRELRDQYGPDGCWWLRQYHNPSNAHGYTPVAYHIANKVGRVDIIVFPVGSGGSLTGTTRTLRENGHPAYCCAVDTPNSILFGPRDGKRALRGLGNSVMPQNLIHELVDETQWIGAAEAFFAARELFIHYGPEAGPTAGAAYIAGRYLAQRHPDKTVVFFAPDSGQRYLTTVYSRAWCKVNGLYVDSLPDVPRQVEHPLEVLGPWDRFAWARRSYRAVTGIDPSTLYAPDLDDLGDGNGAK